MELDEGAHDTGVRRKVGTDLVTGPSGCVPAELGLVTAEQVDPLLGCPAPERPAHYGRVHQ